MAKHVLFIYPNFMIETKHIKTFLGNYYEGVAILAGTLKLSNHQCSLYHLTWMPSKEEFINQIKQFKPDIIGFTVRTSIMDCVTEMLAWLDDELPDIPVICGGYHPTLAPEAVIKTKGVDMVCIGEGERQLRKLVDHFDKTGEFDDTTESFWFKKEDGTIKRNKVHPYVSNLDELPFPDLDLFNFDNLSVTKVHEMDVIVSKGCLYACTYCSNANIRKVYEEHKGYARFRSPENAVKYLEMILEKQPGIQYIAFNDAILNMYEDWFYEFMDLYKKRINKKFTCNLRFDHMDEKMCKVLAQNGCYKVTIGLEQGNEEFRSKYLLRNMKNDNIIRVSKMLREQGIPVITYNIVGLPHETLKLSLETIKLNAKLHADNILCNNFIPYPGTELRRIAKEGGFLIENVKDSDEIRLKMPDYPTNQVLFVKYSFLKLVKRYRKIFNIEDKEKAAKKEAKLDKWLTSKFYPHTLVYWYNRNTMVWAVEIRRIIKEIMPNLYCKLRDIKYKKALNSK